jgi:tripartite-type tricarboxylate transporter receptor subunit TctC
MPKIFRSLVCLALSLLSFAGYAENYPERSIRIIVPYAAGQGTDIIMRLIADQMAKKLGQQVLIDNQPGAGGNIGTMLAKQAHPDGYTIALGTNATHVINKFIYPSLAFDPEADFLPIALTGMLPMVVAVSADSPFNDLQQLLSASRANPGMFNVGLPHNSARIVFEMLKTEAKAPLFGVAYRSLPLADIVSGRIQVTIDTIAATRVHITSGKLKPLAVTSSVMSPLLPGIRSVAQQGVTGFEIMPWSALYAPKGTAPEIVAVLSNAVQQVMGLPQIKDRMLQMGLEPRTMGSDALRDFMKAETKKWGDIIRASNITAD